MTGDFNAHDDSAAYRTLVGPDRGAAAGLTD
eukprot:SAG22_NODE_16338_length_327_cov_0.894737_1_plen_30_part_10